MSEDKKNNGLKAKIRVCSGNKCKERMSQYTFERACNELNLGENSYENGGITEDGNVEVCKTGCMGKCREGVNVKIEKKGNEQSISKVDTIKMGNLMNEFKKFKNKK